MKLSTTLSTIVLALGLATTGCSKKKDAPAADKPATEAAKPTEAKPADPAAPAAAAGEPAKVDTAAAAPAAGAVTIASDDEFIAAGKASITKFMEVLKAAGTDCDKLAKGINELAADPKFAASTAYEKAHPEAKKKFEEVAKAETEAFMKAAEPAFKACMSNQAVGDAIKKLAGE